MKRVLSLALAAATIASSGCVSSRYKLTKDAGTSPPVAPQLTAERASAQATVRSVIVFQGQGSWKREAYWDEYIVALANRGEAPLIVESTELTGLAGTPMVSGVDPWELEKQSRTLAEKRFGLAKDVTVQIGSGLGAITVAAGIGAAIGGSGLAAIGGAALGGIVALPVLVGGSIYRNVSSRHEVEREFDRRRLKLPATLVPAQITQGSLFFPITPGPRQLVVRCRSGDERFEVLVDLATLAHLHLPSTSPTTPAP
ncbi:MAG: hypothetical protein HZC55_13365 [Verrucomicrobia bacterium]|nr:hypothetical protein [Verrucomicrobiota bacterium]